MKLKHNRIFDLLIVDPLPPNAPASYECDPDVPRVIVDAKLSERPDVENKRIRIEHGPQHTLLTPFDFSSEEEFNKLGIEAILLAHRIYKHEIRIGESNPLRAVKKMFYSKNELDVGWVGAVLMSINENAHTMHDVATFCVDNHCKLQMWPQINKGWAYVIPEPEFLGVVPIETLPDGSEKYAIGIINTKPIVKVFLG